METYDYIVIALVILQFLRVTHLERKLDRVVRETNSNFAGVASLLLKVTGNTKDNLS